MQKIDSDLFRGKRGHKSNMDEAISSKVTQHGVQSVVRQEYKVYVCPVNYVKAAFINSFMLFK